MLMYGGEVVDVLLWNNNTLSARSLVTILVRSWLAAISVQPKMDCLQGSASFASNVTRPDRHFPLS
jgi:hypothetical protein